MDSIYWLTDRIPDSHSHPQTPHLSSSRLCLHEGVQGAGRVGVSMGEPQSRCWINQRLMEGFWDNYKHQIALFAPLWRLPWDESTLCAFQLAHMPAISIHATRHLHYSDVAIKVNNQLKRLSVAVALHSRHRQARRALIVKVLTLSHNKMQTFTATSYEHGGNEIKCNGILSFKSERCR